MPLLHTGCRCDVPPVVRLVCRTSSCSHVSAPFFFRASHFCAAPRTFPNNGPDLVLVEVHRVSMCHFGGHSRGVVRSVIGSHKIAANQFQLVELNGATDTTALRIEFMGALIARAAHAANPVVGIVRCCRISVPTPSTRAAIPYMRVRKPIRDPSFHCDLNTTG